jgi:1,4-alpha-glucan branching enzyme
MAAVSLPELHPGLVRSLVTGSHPQPHSTLGQHPVAKSFVIRVVRPLAKTVTATLADGRSVKLAHLDQGLWQGRYSGPGQAYTITTTYDDGPS